MQVLKINICSLDHNYSGNVLTTTQTANGGLIEPANKPVLVSGSVYSCSKCARNVLGL